MTLVLDRLSRRADARARAAWARAAAVLARLADLGVEARVVGSLARGDFAAHSDVDFLVVSCPRSLKYRIEAEVENLMGACPSSACTSTRSVPLTGTSCWLTRVTHPLASDVSRDLDVLRAEAGMLAAALARFGDAALGDDEALRWLAVGGIASGIEKVYSGMERLLRRLAAEVDGHVPRDEAWHVTLLRRMASPLPGARDAVLSPHTLAMLDALRAFRHRERHSYAGDLDPARVLEIAAEVADAVAAFAADVDRFTAGLSGPDEAGR